MRKFLSKKVPAQALIEMAILGPLLLVALGILVNYVVKLNEDNYQLMSAFRRALQKAHDENKVVGYGTWGDRRRASVGQPIIGEKYTSSGSGHVNWAICDVTGQGQDPKSKLFVKINMMEYDLRDESSGAIKPTYFTGTFENISVNKNVGQVSSSRTAGSGEIMYYKVGDRKILQGRGHARSRGSSGGATP